MRRRTFLKVSAAGSALAAVSPSLALLGEESKSNWIDSHVHIWTPDLKSYPLSGSFKKSDMKPESFTAEELFKHCEPHGVKRVVLIQMNFYEFDNRYMIDAIQKYPGRFSGVGIIDENGSDLPGTMKQMRDKGVRGFRLYANLKNVEQWKTSQGMKNMWKLGADLNMAMCLLADPETLPMIEELCKQFPKTPVVIDHFARIGMKGTVNEQDLQRLRSLAKFEKVHVKTSAFYALGAKKAPYDDLGPMIRTLRDTYGAKRLMWGSDAPFQVEEGHDYGNSVALISKRLDFLSDEEKQWMMGGTAERVFFSSI